MTIVLLIIYLTITAYIRLYLLHKFLPIFETQIFHYVLYCHQLVLVYYPGIFCIVLFEIAEWPLNSIFFVFLMILPLRTTFLS